MEELRLCVEDNGVGFHVEEALAKRDSFGLAGMRERVALLGGKFHVDSQPRTRDQALDRAADPERGRQPDPEVE